MIFVSYVVEDDMNPLPKLFGNDYFNSSIESIEDIRRLEDIIAEISGNRVTILNWKTF